MTAKKHIPEVVLYSFFPWQHQYPSTAHGLAKALAKHTRVWFVSKPPTLKDAFQKPTFVKTWSSKVVKSTDEIGDNLRIVELAPTLPVNMLKPGKIYNFLNGLNTSRMNAQLRQILQREGVKEFCWINLYAPTHFDQVTLHQEPEKRIYYSVDAIDQVNYTRRHGLLAEQKQLKSSDMGFTTSTKLAEKLYPSLKKGTQLHILPNAMDAETYLDHVSSPEPDALKHIPHPRVGYLGNLDGARLDFKGLSVLAKARPDISFVFIGPWNAGEERKIEFESLPNIHLLGSKKPEECPAYLEHMDAGIIPFQLSELTAAIYPLKINEYLALGLPVLSTSFSKDIRDFADIISLAPLKDWDAMLDTVLKQSDPSTVQKRKERASSNTWDHRAERLIELMGYEPVHSTSTQPC